jgi:hypothetical protein
MQDDNDNLYFTRYQLFCKLLLCGMGLESTAQESRTCATVSEKLFVT